jgi:hypothetical protein
MPCISKQPINPFTVVPLDELIPEAYVCVRSLYVNEWRELQACEDKTIWNALLLSFCLVDNAGQRIYKCVQDVQDNLPLKVLVKLVNAALAASGLLEPEEDAKKN